MTYDREFKVSDERERRHIVCCRVGVEGRESRLPYRVSPDFEHFGDGLNLVDY
jgi:hypothetical protein